MSERLRAVQRISDAALGTLAFDELVRELLKRILEVLAADTAAVLLHQTDGTVMIYQAAAASQAPAPVARADADAVSDGGVQVSSLLGGAVASTLEAPLTVDGETIGAVHVGTMFARSFTDDDRGLLRLAAGRAAVGIQRARLYEREHGIAQELQRSLLPAALPQLPGLAAGARYFAAGDGSQVGGDWYDAVIQPDGGLLLIVGDVAGRGIAAASTMGQLRSALRAYALDGHGPAALLERLNAFQVGLRNRGMTTVSLVRVDPTTAELRFARAGHPPALIVDAEGRATWLSDARGIPLGAVDDFPFTEGSAKLEPGSTLVLYSDGLVELRGEPLDVGLQRLALATAAAPDDLDGLCDGILAGTLANPSAVDDVTLLVLRMAGPRRRPAEPFPRRRTDVLARQLREGSWPHERVRSAAVELPGGLRASAAARGLVAETLGHVASRPELDDLLIVITELVNNAVVHGGASDATSRVLVHVAAANERLRAEVSSRGTSFEIRAPSPKEEPGGFGLFLVDQLSSRWGIDGGDDYCVWFEIDREGAAVKAGR